MPPDRDNGPRSESDRIARPTSPAPIRLDVKAARIEDVKFALQAGVHDFLKRPLLSLFFGCVFAAFGLLLIASLVLFDQIWLAIAAGVGFPLAAPFLAAGLYDMSRRLKRAEDFRAPDVFLSIFKQRRREFGWMSFIVLFVFWMWAYQVRIVLAISTSAGGFRSLEHFLTGLVTTGDGITFLLIGTVIGAVFATILFTVTVVATPLLLDKDVDIVTAMITSVKTVLRSPAVMLGWGAIVGAATLLSIAPAFVGLIFAFPILGHTTWHLYERLVREA